MSRYIAVLIIAGLVCSSSVAAGEITTEALLDSLKHTAFKFFWYEANPSNGFIKDRSTDWSPCSIASVGFGLTAICIGIDNGYVTREEGRDRVHTTLETFWTAPQGDGASGFMGYKGLFYHFLDMETGERVWDSELSTIDTALLFAGILDAKQYFTENDPIENNIRALADSITQRADWEFMTNGGPGIRMGWKPGSGFGGFGTWIGYNEAMIMYIIALGSPTHPIDEIGWTTWTSGYSWQTHYGYTYVNFPPLFGHQYSHCWIDFRNIQDEYMRGREITYFINSERASRAQHAYCIVNPFGHIGYGETLWGLTASDGPDGYAVHGAPPPVNDDGTITPTAAASSIPFAPDIVIPTLHNFYETYGHMLWDVYGFKDAFNLERGWWGPDYIGIDQGPIIIMIENYHTQSVWNRFMQNPDIQQGLDRAGFTTASDVEDVNFGGAPRLVLSQNEPNPFVRSATISYRLSGRGHVSMLLYDVQGRLVRTVVDGVQPAGQHQVMLPGDGLPSGVYYYSLESNGQRVGKRCIITR
jgi:hypothetical protein